MMTGVRIFIIIKGSTRDGCDPTKQENGNLTGNAMAAGKECDLNPNIAYLLMLILTGAHLYKKGYNYLAPVVRDALQTVLTQIMQLKEAEVAEIVAQRVAKGAAKGDEEARLAEEARQRAELFTSGIFGLLWWCCTKLLPQGR